ncbi:helix-turn-helix transcriptional regulator [Nocardioides sp. AN3]
MQTPSSASATASVSRRPVYVVVASHRELVARGLVSMLADHPEEVLVSVAASLRAVSAGVDVVLYDLALLDDSGPTPLRDVIASAEGRVIGIAEASDGVHQSLAEQFGVAGCVPTEVHGGDLLFAIATVAAGRRLPPRVEARGPFTRREAEIMGLIAQGLSNEEIARRLVISANTLKSHIRQAYRKIGVATRAQAVAWVTQRGLG